MSHHHLHKGPIAPAGGNMNDVGYPFRGEYRVDKKLNHGHGGITKVLPSSFGIHISGDNILLSNINVPKNLHLDCELSVGHERPQLVAFPFADSTLSVPPDGREYHFTAVVTGPQQKHYAKMIFQNKGNSAASPPSLLNHPLRVIHDLGLPIPLVFVYPDGQEVRPFGGVFDLPPPHSGGSLRLRTDGPVDWPAQAPLSSPPTLDEGSSVPPEVDTTMGLTPDKRFTVFTVRAAGFSVDISTNGDGSIPPTSGHGFASIDLPATREHRVRFVLRCPVTGKTVLGQSATVPALGAMQVQAPTQQEVQHSGASFVVPVRLSDNAADPTGSLTPLRETLRITSGPDFTVSSGGSATASGLEGIAVDPTVPQWVTIRNPQSGAEASLNLGGLTPSEPQWIADLTRALGAHGPKKRRDDVMAGLRNIRPLSPSGRTLVDAIQNLLGEAPPTLSISIGDNGLLLRNVKARGGTLGHPLHVEASRQLITETSTIPLQQHGTPIELLIKNDANDTEAVVLIEASSDCGGTKGAHATAPASSGDNPDAQFLGDLSDAMDRYVPGATGNSLDAWDGPAQQRLLRDLGRLPCPTPASAGYLPRLLQLLRKAASDAEFLQELAALLRRCPEYFITQPPTDRTFFKHLGTGVGRLDAPTDHQKDVRDNLANTFVALNPTALRLSNPHSGCRKHPLPTMKVEMDGVPTSHRLDGEELLPGTRVATIVADGPCCTCLDRGSTSPFVRELADAYKAHERNHTPVQSLRDDWSAIRPGDDDESDLQWALKRLLDKLIDAMDAAKRAAEMNDHNRNRSAPLALYPSITYEVNNRTACLDNVRVQPVGEYHMIAFLDGAQQQLPVADGGTVPYMPMAPLTGNNKRSIDLVVKDLQGNIVTRTSVVLSAGSSAGPVGNLDVSIAAENNDTVVRMAVDAPYRLQWREEDGADATSHYQRLMRAARGPNAFDDQFAIAVPAAPSAALKLDSTTPHQLVVTVVDSTGRPVHESRVGVPRLCNPGCTVSWKDNTVVATPDVRTLFTASLDGGQERVIAHPLSLDPDVPHQVRLKHVHTDGRSAKLGEVLLDIPPFIDPRDLHAIIQALKGAPATVVPTLSHLLNTVHSTTTKKLVQSILDVLGNMKHANQVQDEEDESLRYRRRHGAGGSPSDDGSKHIFFRLRGDEGKR